MMMWRSSLRIRSSIAASYTRDKSRRYGYLPGHALARSMAAAGGPDRV